MIDTPIFVIGASGMFGRAWCRLLLERGIDHQPTSRVQLDLAQRQTIDQSITGQHRVVVNCAAYTDVDGAEDATNSATADAINHTGVADLANRCRQIDALLVHYSTDYVFNGQATQPYSVDHPRDPVNAYGHSKSLGEQAIERSGCRHVIIRTSWLYAPWGKNFVRTIAGLAQQRDSLRVVDDQRGRPTSCQHLAQTSLQLIEHSAQGVYHVTDGGECTWCEFATEIARLTGAECEVQPCRSDEFPRPAPRPAYSVLDLSQTQRLIGPMPLWKDNLAMVMREMEQVHT